MLDSWLGRNGAFPTPGSFSGNNYASGFSSRAIFLELKFMDNLSEYVRSITGNDTMMLFGKSGTCKTTFAVEILKESAKAGNKALYIDTEKNIINGKELGCDYLYCSSFDTLYMAIQNLAKGYTVVVLDSLGLPVLGEFATKDQRNRGEILLRAESMSYMLKKYSQENSCLVIVCNQPVSEFGKDEGVRLDPFGDKSRYFYKEIWYSRMILSNPNETKCSIQSFRSRRMGQDAKILNVTVSNSGVKIDKAV